MVCYIYTVHDVTKRVTHALKYLISEFNRSDLHPHFYILWCFSIVCALLQC